MLHRAGRVTITAMRNDHEDEPTRLADARTHLAVVQRIADLGSWEADVDTDELHWSDRVCDILGVPRTTAPDYEVFIGAVHPDDRARLVQALADALQASGSFTLDHRIVRPDGSVRHVHQATTVELEDGRAVRLHGTMRDITDHMAVTRTLVETESRRRDLLHRLVRASERERAELAGDLHDGPIQMLTVAAMRLELLGMLDPDPPAWLPDAIQTARETVVQLRDVLVELHPRAGAGAGLDGTLAQLALTVVPELDVEVVVRGDTTDTESRAVFGIVQEALWDVREGARTSHLDIRVDALDDEIDLTLRGGPRTADAGAGLLGRTGLLGVRERTEGVGGRCTLEEAAGIGSCAAGSPGTGSRTAIVAETAELRRVLGQLRSAHRVAGIGTWEADFDNQPGLRWSPELRVMAGWTLDRDPTWDELVGMLHPDDRPLYLEVRASALAGERPYAMDLRFLRPDGEQRRVHLLAEVVRDHDGRPTRLIGAAQDRTEEIDGLRRLRMTEVVRRDLLQRLLVTADTERGRLARHLASGPIDRLVSIERRLVAEMPADEPQAWVDALASVRRAIESLAQTLSAMQEEAPTRDLLQILEDLATEAVPDVDVTVELAAGLSLRPSLQATLLRVVQEALHNIRKHADARSARIRFDAHADWVLVEVSDDGCGFDPSSVQGAAGHLGLVAMQDRVTALGGELQIRSQPGGTKVAARLPVT